MIGSAAARHATLKHDLSLKVCLIGPKEPRVRKASQVQGAYYDESRITRSLDPHPIWSELGRRSIQRYRQLERETGINFYETVGILLFAQQDHQFLKKVRTTAQHQSINIKELNPSDMRKQFPGLHVSDNDLGLAQFDEAGYINPRRLVCAQQTAAHAQGCDIIRDVAVGVEELADQGHMKVVTYTGQVIFARQVLLAPGAFTSFYRLLPYGIQPDVQLITQTVLFGELSDQDSDRMRGFPSIIYRGSQYNNTLAADDDKDGLYVLPPLRYPNGKIYMKIGHKGHFEQALDTQKEVYAWYCNPAPTTYKKELTAWINKLFPAVSFRSYYTDTCLTNVTPTGLPYIDLIHDRLGVAMGGNGRAAKACDEIGRMAVELLLKGVWNHQLPAEAFTFRRKCQSIDVTHKSKL